MPNATEVDDDDRDSLYSIDSLEEQSSTSKIESVKCYENSANEKMDHSIIRQCVKDNIKNVHAHNGETLVPFYSGELSLQEIRILQNNARKKVKGLPRKPVLSAKEYNPNISNNKEPLLSLDKLPPRMNSFSSNTSGTAKSYFSTENQQRPNSNEVKSGRSRSAIKNPVTNTRGKSMSYLERFRKRVEVTNKQQSKAESVCSTVGGTNCRNRSPLSCSDISDAGRTFASSRITAYSGDEEDFYRNIINNSVVTKQSSSNSSLYNSCEESYLLSEIPKSYQKQNTVPVQVHGETDVKSTRFNNKLNQKNGGIRKGKPEFADTLGKLGTLGPDIEMTKQKLDIFMKRKEYGNNVSCKNRLDILQKRETYALKPDLAPRIEPTKMPVPVVTFNVDPIANVFHESSNKTQETHHSVTKPIKKTVKKNDSLNAVEKKRRDQNNNDKGIANGIKNLTIDENAAQILLKRHELEKKMADRIRDQFTK